MRSTPILLIAILVGCGGDDASNPEQVCLGTSTQCGDTCVSLASDQDNCGACGNACGGDEVCDNGTCTMVLGACPSGQMSCGGTCKDTQVDADHCGACDNACNTGYTCDAGACVLETWEILAPMPVQIMWVDSAPAGETVAYGVSSSALYKYTLPTDAEPLGVYDSALMAVPASVDGYTTISWVGTALYVIQNTSLYKYDITGDTWTTEIDQTLDHDLNNAQSDHDDDGNIYAWAGDQFLVAINTADNTPTYVQGPADLSTTEPRAAWDSASNKLYLGDYDDTAGTFYSYDPSNMMFTPLASFPHEDGFGDAFCSDRNGHIYATSSGDSNTSDVWVYTVATDTWSPLPNLPTGHGSSPSCFVANGYLYVSNGDEYYLARLAL